jgi:hypothetical protein
LLIHTYEQEEIKERKAQTRNGYIKLAVCLAVFLLVCWLLSGHAYADNKIVVKADNIAGYSVNQWCNAIYKAEGGEKTRHPYGILARYKHATPRQACINTIRHKYAIYKRSGLKTPFLDYLGEKYAPTGKIANDPTHLNNNWTKNVSYWLKKGA